MKKILEKYPETVLISLAVLFVAVVGGYLYVTIGTVIPEVDRAIATPSVTPPAGFDLPSAKKIDFKGLVDASGTAVSSTATVPVRSAAKPSSIGAASATPSSSAATSANTAVSASTSTAGAPTSSIASGAGASTTQVSASTSTGQ